MPRTFSSAAFAALLACVATAQAPVNDQPSGALVFSEPSTLFDDNSASALDGPYPLCGNPTSDLWYLFVPTTSGVATVTTCSAAGGGTGSLGSLGDSILGAWTDGGGFPATAITCDDDFCASQFLASMMTFPVTAGVPVYLSVCGYGLSSGTYLLDVTVVVASPSVFSDDCASATTVSEGVHPYDTSGFGVAGPAPGCTGYANDPFDGWLAYVPSATGFATASNCPGSLLAPGGAAGGGFDTYLAVWDGASCPPSGPELACADGSPQCFSTQSEATWPVVGGQTYYLQIGTWGAPAPASGSVAVTLAPAPPPAGPGDDCSVAVPMVVPGLTPFNSAGFTAPGPQASCSGIGGPDVFDVWMSFVATSNGVAVVSNCPGSSLAPAGFATPADTYLAAWDGATCPPSTRLACQDGSPQCGTAQSEISFPITAGAAYYVQVGTWGSASPASGAVSVVEIPAPSDDECAGASPLAYGLNPGLSNVAATTSSPTGGCGAMGADVWFSFTPVCTGPLVISTCGSGFDTVLAVFDACGGNQVACNDDAGAAGPCPSTLQSYVTFQAVAFQTYFIAVGGFSGQTGAFDLDVRCTYLHRWSTPNVPGSLRLENVDGPPGAVAYSAVTLDLLHPGLPAASTFPNGWFYGVPIGFAEVLAQLTQPPPQPFLSLLDGSGYSLNANLPPGAVSSLLGATLWSVGVALDPATGFASIEDVTAPTASTIL